MSSAAGLYSKALLKGVVGNIPKAPLSASARKALRESIWDIEAIAKRRGDHVDPWELNFEKSMAIDHFEMLAWLKWYMDDPKHQASVGARALIVALLFQTGIEKPSYEFFTLTRFGERQFDNIFENGDGDEVVEELLRFAKGLKSGVVDAGISRYGWDRDRQAKAA